MFGPYSGEAQETLFPASFAGSRKWTPEIAPEIYPELFPELSQPPAQESESPTPGTRPAVGAGACLIRRNFEVIDFFQFNSATLRAFHINESREIARRIAAGLAGPQPIRRIHVVGHTDSRGRPAFNQTLGKSRAQAVAARLALELGANRARITISTDTRGETLPVAPNTVDRGRACNRRVEIFFDRSGGRCLGCSFRHFFTNYDLRFLPGDPSIGIPANPNLTPAQKSLRTADVTAVLPELLRRRNARAIAALSRRVLPAAPAPAPIVPAVVRLSRAQLALYRTCFPDGAGGIRFNDFQRCFEQFANGELRDPAHPDQGGPNGGFFFLFAEFAFLCIESGIDVREWTQALRTFVKTQEIFMHVFRPRPHRTPPPVGAPLPPPCPRPRPLDSNPRRSGNGFEDINFNALGQSNAARKAALRRKYARLAPAALRAAAAQNLLRARCMP
jgi:outer membrane protein OmpA-like peptidoglycan-associated protein